MIRKVTIIDDKFTSQQVLGGLVGPCPEGQMVFNDDDDGDDDDDDTNDDDNDDDDDYLDTIIERGREGG